MMHATSAFGVSAKRLLGKTFLTVLLATSALSASAAVPTLALNFDNTGGAAGSGPNVDIGWRFSIASPISVSELGFWDAGGDGLGESHAVAIWNTSGLGDLASALVSGTVAAGLGSPFHPGSQFRVVNVTATVLPAGDYVIGSRLTGILIDSYKQDTDVSNLVVDPGITFIQKRFDFHASFARPDQTNGTSGLFGPNFAFTAVPEPSTIALAALGFAGLARCGWRRRRRSH